MIVVLVGEEVYNIDATTYLYNSCAKMYILLPLYIHTPTHTHAHTHIPPSPKKHTNTDDDPALTFKDHHLHTALLYSLSSPPTALRGIHKKDIPTLVQILAQEEDYLSALTHTLPSFSSSASPPTLQKLQGKDMFVCAHASRDARCKACGPPLVEWLKQAAATDKENKENEEVRVWPSSHVGGHVHAGNVLVFPGGHWYGKVNDCEKAKILLQKDEKEDPLRHPELKGHWRGKMGLNEIEQDELAVAAVGAARGAGGK